MTNIKSILVTGAGGYIGRHVVEKLLDLGIEVTSVDNNAELIDVRANRIEYDIFSNKENIYEDLGRPDVCLHI